MAIISGNDSLTAKNLFSFLRSVKTPTAGELREPITFYRSHRVPVVNQDGTPTTNFTQEITPYHNAWAKVYQAQDANLDGQNTANYTSHVFLVRNFKGFSPQIRDGVVWLGNLHSIQGTRNLEGDDRRAWLIILCQQMGLFAEEPRDNTLTPEPDVQEPVAADPLNPIWI